MTAHDPMPARAKSRTGRLAALPETDLGGVGDLELVALAVDVARTDPSDEIERTLRLLALSEIEQEVGVRTVALATGTLPVSARGCVAAYHAYRGRLRR